MSCSVFGLVTPMIFTSHAFGLAVVEVGDEVLVTGNREVLERLGQLRVREIGIAAA